MKITKQQLRRIIREAISNHHESKYAKLTGTKKEWDDTEAARAPFFQEFDNEEENLNSKSLSDQFYASSISPTVTAEDSIETLAAEFGLQRSDALLGAAMELEARDPELSYIGRKGSMGADVYLRYDNTYTVEAYGERHDGLDSQELLDMLEQI